MSAPSAPRIEVGANGGHVEAGRSARRRMRNVASLVQVLRSATFRLVLSYLALFLVSVTALGWFLYWATAQVMEAQTDETIAAEIRGLAEQYERTGLPGLRDVVAARSRDQRHSLYLLVSPGRSVRLAGNIDGWPGVPTDAEGYLDFTYSRQIDDDLVVRAARARHLGLRGGFELLVGRDVQERRDFERLMSGALSWAMALTVLLGLVGGFIMSRNMLRRLNSINRTTAEIVAGDFSRRILVRGDDEISELSSNLNTMLDRIEVLMNGLRQVSDNIAHDLRSPLTRLRTKIEVTLKEPRDAETYRELLAEVIAETDRLLGIFAALLKIAEVEAGVPKLERVDLSTVATDMAELYAGSAEAKRIDWHVDVPAAVTIAGDRDLLGQALANLLDNAIKYTPEGGRVSLSLRRADKRAEVVIADSGPGIPEADRQRVFGRFVRLDQSRRTPGSGLGLSLVKAVVGLHGGGIVLSDAEPGLKITLSFPVLG